MDENVINESFPPVRNKINEYGEENIYKSVETGLFYKQMPTKTIASKIQRGVKNFKDRLSLSPCCNLGETDKRKSLMIGVSKSPRPSKTSKPRNILNIQTIKGRG